MFPSPARPAATDLPPGVLLTERQVSPRRGGRSGNLRTGHGKPNGVGPIVRAVQVSHPETVGRPTREAPAGQPLGRKGLASPGNAPGQAGSSAEQALPRPCVRPSGENNLTLRHPGLGVNGLLPFSPGVLALSKVTGLKEICLK